MYRLEWFTNCQGHLAGVTNAMIRIISALLALLTFGWLHLSAMAQGGTTPKLFALIVADTADRGLRAFLEADRDNLKRVLEEGFATRPHRLQLAILDGDDVTPQQVLAHYRNLRGRVRPEDSLLFFYTGHGAATVKRGHILTMTRGELDRKQLREAMTALRPRLTIILSDACSRLKREFRGVEVKSPPKATWPVMDCLFFNHEGVTDINGCGPNSFGWCHRDEMKVPRGGTFALALVPLLCQKIRYFTAADDYVTWQQFTRELQKDTDKWFQLTKKAILRDSPETEDGKLIGMQATQIPEVFAQSAKSRQKIAADNFWLFGAHYTSDRLNGQPVVILSKVYPKTPAAEAGFKANDVILRVDGRGISTQDGFYRAVEYSDGVIQVEFRRGGETASAKVALRPVKPMQPK